MTQRPGHGQVEFIRLNGTAVRVTSWTETEPGRFRLVAIVRGSGEARTLAEVLGTAPLDLEVPGDALRPVVVEGLERRETGTPPATITRFAVDLRVGSEAVPAVTPRTIEERVAHLEDEVASLRALIQAIANDR